MKLEGESTRSKMVVELDVSLSNEFTLAMIKPDAVAAGSARDIMHAIESNGFHIIAKNYLEVRVESFRASVSWNGRPN